MPRRWKTIGSGTHSRGAADAEARGEYPLTRAIERVYKEFACKERKISRKKVRKFLEDNCHKGWHHVAGPGRVRKIDYFATELTDDQRQQLLDLAAKNVANEST